MFRLFPLLFFSFLAGTVFNCIVHVCVMITNTLAVSWIVCFARIFQAFGPGVTATAPSVGCFALCIPSATAAQSGCLATTAKVHARDQ